MPKDEFQTLLNDLTVKINDFQYNQLERYYELIIEYNKKINLTRITDKQEVFIKHFLDSITINKIIKLDNQKLLDIGSGAGFPGIVLKIMFPNLKITLLDSLNKRVNFLNDVIKILDLKNIEAVHDRAEDYVINNREKFDIVTSRAVANLNTLSELSIPFVKINGYFIAMKANCEDEIENSKNAFKKLNCVIKNKISFNLPINKEKRTLIKIEKISKTLAMYPRKFSEIKKKPL